MNLRLIGERVRDRRKEKGLSIADFAQALHVTTRSVALIESGQANIDLQCLVDMCICLDRTPNQLLQDNYIVTEQTRIEDAMALVGLTPEEVTVSKEKIGESTVITDALTARRRIQEMLSEYKMANPRNLYHR